MAAVGVQLNLAAKSRASGFAPFAPFAERNRSVSVGWRPCENVRAGKAQCYSKANAVQYPHENGMFLGIYGRQERCHTASPQLRRIGCARRMAQMGRFR